MAEMEGWGGGTNGANVREFPEVRFARTGCAIRALIARRCGTIHRARAGVEGFMGTITVQ